MEQKEIKEIARIIEKISVNTKPTGKGFREVLIMELADYFERENPKPKGMHQSSLSSNIWYCDGCNYQVKPNDWCKCEPFNKKQFNKKQFLKDCEVSK